MRNLTDENEALLDNSLSMKYSVQYLTELLKKKETTLSHVTMENSAEKHLNQIGQLESVLRKQTSSLRADKLYNEKMRGQNRVKADDRGAE